MDTSEKAKKVSQKAVKEEVQEEEAPVVPFKKKNPVKRVMSEKQKDNLKKGLEALKAKRAMLKKTEEEEDKMMKEHNPIAAEQKEGEKYLKAKKQRAARPAPPPFATRSELVAFKNEMLSMYKPSEIVKEVVKEVPVSVEKIVEVEKRVEIPTTRVITGKEMLDKIFFNR